MKLELDLLEDTMHLLMNRIEVLKKELRELGEL